MIRGLGLRGAIAVNVITMIGIGPLITIPLVLANLHGSLALAAWIAGAVIALCDGLIWAELASQFPGSGGTYVYLLETFGRERLGRLLAFLFTWQTVLSVPLLLATGYIGFAKYAGYLWPVLGSDARVQGIVAAAVGILTLALLYRPIGAVAATSFAFAAIAIATLGALIVAAAPHLSVTQALSVDRSAPLFGALLAGLGPALVITLYDYFGYAQSCLLGDEVRQPARVLPRSIVISILGIATLYIALQIGVLGVVRWQELVPATPGGDAPAAANFVASTVLERTWGLWAARIGTVAILITAFASTFGNLLGASRIPYAAAVDGVFLKPFAALERSGRFPHVALLTLGLLALPACFFTLDNVIAALTAATVLIQNLAQVAILFVLRARGGAAPYRMWLYPFPALLAGAGWIYIFCSSGFGAIVYGLLTLGAGALVYLVRARLRSEWPFSLKAAGTLGILLLALLCTARPAAAWGSSAIVERRGVPVFTVAGKPFFVYGAAFFYERLPRDRWLPSMRALRGLGINTLDLYVPWNWHELSDGNFDFDGHSSPRRDLREVIRLSRAFGFRIVLRPGPVVRNEWRNGGYPAWLLQRAEYGMPLHDLLEGRYPPTATLQNAHSDDAAAQWLANATHLYYAKRWLERALHEFDGDSSDVIAVALDDDQGAYLDNDTWPAPHFQAYLRWLEGVVHGVTGPLEPVFINTYQMKVTAASPVWAMGNWYQSDAYELAEHDRAQLEFSTGLLQTRPGQPVMLSEFQAGWLEQPGDIRPRPADPSNTLLAMASMLALGARGIINFPAQDTLYPSGMEAPFANAFYAWDAALALDDSPSARAAPTAAIGRFIAAFGRSLAASVPVTDLAIGYPVAAYGDVPPDNAAVARIAARTIETQQACRALSLACRLVDLRFSDDATLRTYPLLVIPDWSQADAPAPPFEAGVAAKLERYREGGGRVAVLHAGRDAAELSAAVASAGLRPEIRNAPGASFARSYDGQVDGYLFIPNYGERALVLHDVAVRIDAHRELNIPRFVVPARDFIATPVDLRAQLLGSGSRVNYTDCPVRIFSVQEAAVPKSDAASQARACRFYFTGGESVAFDPEAPRMPNPTAQPTGLPIRRDAVLPVDPPLHPLGAGASLIGYGVDVYHEGADATVLQNALVRVVISPQAGARAFVFEDLATGRSIFTTVGAMRDDVSPEPPFSTTDRIAKYTHQFPAGTFNRNYLLGEPNGDGVRFSYVAPDVWLPDGPAGALQSVRFERTVSLPLNSRTFSVDERVTFGADGSSQGPLRAVSVSSLAVGAALDMHTAWLLVPDAEPFSAHATRRVSGNALGFYDTATGELATLAWRSGGVERADVLEQDYSVVARLTLAPGATSHFEFGYLSAPSLSAARAALDGAERAAQGQPTAFANLAR